MCSPTRNKARVETLLVWRVLQIQNARTANKAELTSGGAGKSGASLAGHVGLWAESVLHGGGSSRPGRVRRGRPPSWSQALCLDKVPGSCVPIHPEPPPATRSRRPAHRAVHQVRAGTSHSASGPVWSEAGLYPARHHTCGLEHLAGAPSPQQGPVHRAQKDQLCLGS